MADSTVQLIVLFNSWKNRSLTYANRKKGIYSISADFTRENYRFFKAIKVIVGRYPDKIAFSFLDVNCRIEVKLKSGSLKFPKSTKDLMGIIKQ